MVKKPEGGRANHIYRRSNTIPTQFICAWSDEHSKAKKVKYRQQMCSRDGGNCNGFWPWWSFLASQNCHQTIGATSGTFDQPGTPQPVSVPSLQHFCHPYFIHIGFGMFIKACANKLWCDCVILPDWPESAEFCYKTPSNSAAGQLGVQDWSNTTLYCRQKQVTSYTSIHTCKFGHLVPALVIAQVRSEQLSSVVSLDRVFLAGTSPDWSTHPGTWATQT